MINEEYFKKVNEESDLTEELRATIATARFFIESLGMNETDVLAEIGITKEMYDLLYCVILLHLFLSHQINLHFFAAV